MTDEFNPDWACRPGCIPFVRSLSNLKEVNAKKWMKE